MREFYHLIDDKKRLFLSSVFLEIALCSLDLNYSFKQRIKIYERKNMKIFYKTW